MQKNLKRALAFLMALVLLFSAVPMSAFAAEGQMNDTTVADAPPSEEPPKNSQPEPSAVPDLDPTPCPEDSQEPDGTELPDPEANSSIPAEPSPTSEVPAEPDSPYETELAQVDAQQIWPILQRAKTRAAGVGTGGVLQIGYYCFTSAVGVVPTLGEYVSEMPAKTMVTGGTHVAAYCLEHQKGASSDTPYTWMDLSVTSQDAIGTILALGFQWNGGSYWHGPSDEGDKWAVTQMLVWEAISGHISLQNGLYSVAQGVDADMERCAPHAHNSAKFLEYWNQNLK